MAGTVDFRHDVRNDIVVCTPHWTMETAEDCRAGFKQCDDYFSQFYRKIDVVFVLDDLKISGDMIGVWGEYRTKMVDNYIRYTRRVKPTMMVNIAVMLSLSGAKNKNPNGVADSVEAGIAEIKADRAKAGIQ
jgi:hypothetical protein